MTEPVNSPGDLLARLDADQSPESLAERAYREIRDRLVMLDIRPGSPINEDQLGASLAIGRTPVREALKRLANERLVVAYPRRGTFATDVNITDLGHISEVRQHLEPIAAASAARRATATQRTFLADLAVRLLSPATAAAGRLRSDAGGPGGPPGAVRSHPQPVP